MKATFPRAAPGAMRRGAEHRDAPVPIIEMVLTTVELDAAPQIEGVGG
ncbi:hypothetical protein [Streptomyces sp. NBC_00083]|nr:hypothetical protein [Streptomyces sp. NBC_00083]MCX5384213.1 hypothetical protein [Streptomyces sp. NBC_00083]